MNTFLHFTPRILSLLFIGFLSLFALDVFNEYEGSEAIIPLFIHLIPMIVLLVAVLVAWRYSLLGAAVFFVFAVWYVWEAGFDRPWSWYALIAGPALVTALLYLGDWLHKNKKKISEPL